MKVIHLCLGKANPERMNGVNKVVDALACVQIEQGVDVEVWGITSSPNIPTPERSYPLKLFQGNGRSFSMPVGMGAAIEALPKDTVVHIHGVLISVFYGIAWMLKKQGIAWVLAPHGAYNKPAMRYRAWLKYPFVVIFDSFILRHAKAIHVSTKSEIAAVKWLCSKTPVVLINNGQNLDDYKSFKPTEIKIAQRPVFGFVGRLAVQHKGLDILVEGFTQYIKQGGRGVLWFVGDGDERSTVEKMVQPIKDHVVFYGAQYSEDKLNLIHAMDVFVHTSRWEVMPLAILEAASLSRPLLLSTPTNLGDFVLKFDAGFVLKENTPDILCKTMLNIDKDVEQLPIKGQNARAMVEADFTWQSIAQDLMKNAYQ